MRPVHTDHCPRKGGQARNRKPFPLTEKGKVNFMKRTTIIFLSVLTALAIVGCNGRHGTAYKVAGGRSGTGLPVEEMAFMPVREGEMPELVIEPVVETPGISQEGGSGQEEGQRQKEGRSQEEGQCHGQAAEAYQEAGPAQEEEPGQGANLEQEEEPAPAGPLEAPVQESGPAESANSGNYGEDHAGVVQEGSRGDITAETTPAAYNPQEVASLATAKVKAGGKLILSEELDRKLSEGMITQEEYQEYYPYDGTGYYSVFVETDLNQASTTSGRALGSVDGIAQYLADMLLLEAVPSVGVEYAGVYTLHGSQFYEFRCHR